MDEADQIPSLEPKLDSCQQSMANRRPDPMQQGFHADAMCGGRPQLDLGVRKRGCHHLQQRPRLYLYERVLLLGIRRGMARSGHLLPMLEALQTVPGALRHDRTPQCGNHPIGESKCSRVALGAGSRWAVGTDQCHLAGTEMTTAWRQSTDREGPPLLQDVGTDPKALACHVAAATQLPAFKRSQRWIGVRMGSIWCCLHEEASADEGGTLPRSARGRGTNPEGL
jgi:hypothetical protein